ncbi:MAG: ATP-binding protein, partial [Candidatus Moraniibacteriota bacterium]
MKKELLLKEILAQNKHWNQGGFGFEEQKHRRKLFSDLLKYLPERQILSIVGLRRTGKTMLLKQLIGHLMNQKKVHPQKIFFISFDEALVTSKLTLENYIETYFEYLGEEGGSEKTYIFLDEIQYIGKWQHILKRYYDRHPNIKFVVSGSSSLFLKKKTTESLAGRIYEFKLPPLSFEEFLELSDENPELLMEYRKFSVPVVSAHILHTQKEYDLFLTRFGDTLTRLFEDYLLYYQFPEMVGQHDMEKIRKYIAESVYKKALEYDIPRLFGVEKVDELKFLFQTLVHENGSLLEFQTLSSEAGIEENTLKKYLLYFQESFLVDVVYNYSKSFRKSKRLQKKAYISSTNFFTAFRSEWLENPLLKAEYFGLLVETYIFNILKERFQYVSFLRKGREEVDFVVNNDYRNEDGRRMVEVKYVNSMEWKDIRFIDKTAKRLKSIPY